MRILLHIVALLCFAFHASAQQPEGDVVLTDNDSAKTEEGSHAFEILESYRHLLPPHEFDRGSWLIRSWTPHIGLVPQRLWGTEHHLWMSTEMMPRVKIKAPRFLDYNSVTLRIGTNGSSAITISNGSAFNHMPWPNAPQGYRDARTLSFPLPR